jgi:hypothetical protein
MTAETAPSPEELNSLALAAAVAATRADDAIQRERYVRKVAGERFALARKLGLPQVAVMLPGNVQAGLLALKQGGTTVTVDEDGLLLLIAAALPSECEDYVTDDADGDPAVAELLAEHCPDLVEARVKPGALADDRAVKVLAEHMPEYVNLRIKPGQRAELQVYLEAHGGKIPHPGTGEPVKVATITQHDPTGDYQWSGKKQAMPLVREALEAGRLVITPSGDVVASIPGETVAPDALESGEAA